jgi:hypothetical protein
VKLGQHWGSLVAILALAALVLFWMHDRGAISDAERKDREHDVFPAYRRGDIDFLELVQGGVKVRIEKRAEKGDAGDTYWRLTSPADERADPAAVDRLVGDLEFAGVLRRVDPSQASDVSKSFASPRVTGTLSMKPLVYHFALGGPAPVPEGAAYFRVDGEGTFVVSKDFVASLLASPDTYRDRVVVPYLSLDLAAVDITTPKGTLSLARVDEIAWKLVSSGLRASRDGMDRLWGPLGDARAASFLSDADAEKALGPSPIRVVLTPRNLNKPKGELAFGGPCPSHPDDIVVLRTAPTREGACVGKGVLTALTLGEDALVDRRLFVSRQDEVAEIRFEALPGLVVDLARREKGWHERKPTDRDLSGSEVDVMNELVTKLVRGEATSVTQATAEWQPRARVTIHRGGTGAEEVVDLGPTNDLVRRHVDGAILHVPEDLGRRLWPSEIAFRSRAVFPNGIDVGAATELRTACDEVHQVVTHEAGAWKMREPVSATADTLTSTDTAALIRNAQAESWVADADDGSFGLGKSTCKMGVTVPLEGGTQTFTLTFGKETDGGFYAKASNDGAVFLASRGLRDGAKVWLLDRSGFRVDPQRVGKVTLRRGASRTVIEGHGGSGVTDAGRLDRGARVLDALGVLRPEVVVHLGPPRPDEGFGASPLDVEVRLEGDSAPRVHFALGDTAVVNRERMVYARIDGIDATYGVAREHVLALLDAL